MGLTGGIATGKSLVSEYFRELGAYVIDYDMISRLVVEPELPAWYDIVKYFGRGILQKDRRIDRTKLGVIVFNNKYKRKKLESYIHPCIIEEAKKQESAIVKTDPNAIIIHNVPLLFETGIDKSVDITIAIYADEGKQLDRLIKRDGMNEVDANNRMKAHFSSQEKIKRADFVIDNNGPMEETKRQVQEPYVRISSPDDKNHN